MRCKDMNNLVFSKNDAAILFFFCKCEHKLQATLLTVFGRNTSSVNDYCIFNDGQTQSGST